MGPRGWRALSGMRKLGRTGLEKYCSKRHKLLTRLRFEVFSLEKLRTLDQVLVPNSTWDRFKFGS